jgi:hypothetical protein
VAITLDGRQLAPRHLSVQIRLILKAFIRIASERINGSLGHGMAYGAGRLSFKKRPPPLARKTGATNVTTVFVALAALLAMSVSRAHMPSDENTSPSAPTAALSATVAGSCVFEFARGEVPGCIRTSATKNSPWRFADLPAQGCFVAAGGLHECDSFIVFRPARSIPSPPLIAILLQCRVW